MTDPRLPLLAQRFGLIVTSCDGRTLEVEPNLAFLRLAGLARLNPEPFAQLRGPLPFRVRHGQVRPGNPLSSDHGLIVLA